MTIKPSARFQAVLSAVFSNPGRDFTEDFGHENGQYLNICCRCAQNFVGHKRRVNCKVCVELPVDLTPAQ
jgi:hypothetical protein